MQSKATVWTYQYIFIVRFEMINLKEKKSIKNSNGEWTEEKKNQQDDK